VIDHRDGSLIDFERMGNYRNIKNRDYYLM